MEVIVKYHDDGKAVTFGAMMGELVRCNKCWKRGTSDCTVFGTFKYNEENWYCADGEMERGEANEDRR